MANELRVLASASIDLGLSGDQVVALPTAKCLVTGVVVEPLPGSRPNLVIQAYDAPNKGGNILANHQLAAGQNAGQLVSGSGSTAVVTSSNAYVRVTQTGSPVLASGTMATVDILGVDLP